MLWTLTYRTALRRSGLFTLVIDNEVDCVVYVVMLPVKSTLGLVVTKKEVELSDSGAVQVISISNQLEALDRLT